MRVGSLVKINDHPNAKTYPKGMGVVMHYHDQGLHERYNVVDILWPDTGDYRSVRQMFVEVVSESG
jgi:hypothetical protein